MRKGAGFEESSIQRGIDADCRRVNQQREKTQAIRLLGDVDLDVLPMSGELLVDYSIQLKRILGQKIFVLGYSHFSPGYIPPARVIEEGGILILKQKLFRK
ncbi:MAG: hypothetical protein WDZ53_06595 [Balneolales bacterium]